MKKLTRLAMKPQTSAADYLAKRLPVLSEDGAHDPNDVLIELLEHSKDVRHNNTGLLEDMLMAQAMVLNTVFYEHLGKADRSPTLEEQKAYMGMALKAQSLSRCAAEALVEIKNPRPYFQQNSTAHTQQVNNHLAPAHGEKPKTTNELLSHEGGNHAAMDFSRAQKAIRIDTDMETVGVLNGAAH